MASRSAFTLVELLAVIGVIIVLAALILPGIGLVRERSRQAAARLQIDQVQAAVELYRGEDPLRNYPVMRADRTLRWERNGTGLADLLEIRGLAVNASNTISIDAGAPALADPWRQALQYHLDAHTTGDGIAVMPADAAGERVRVPDDAADWNPPRGQPARQTVPFAYIWSWGRPAAGHDLRSNTRNWIYARQGAPQP
jgi:type II secretory pathway pseudopilin PulG